MYRNSRHYIEAKKDTLTYQAIDIHDTLQLLMAHLEDLGIEESQWKKVDELGTKLYLVVEEIKDEIFSL